MEERPVRIRWGMLWATILGLIIIGWTLGLLVHPPAAELIKCSRADLVQVAVAEEGGVVAFCLDE